jgi:hypothetical protein
MRVAVKEEGRRKGKEIEEMMVGGGEKWKRN